jgi:hypothetical protein
VHEEILFYGLKRVILSGLKICISKVHEFPTDYENETYGLQI